jgi:hypothetical protein
MPWWPQRADLAFAVSTVGQHMATPGGGVIGWHHEILEVATWRGATHEVEGGIVMRIGLVM